MGFGFRKSKKIGPFKFNLSKGGLGVSVGVKGARVGISPNGKAYASGGMYGLTYRESYGGKKKEIATEPFENSDIMNAVQEKTHLEVLLGAFGLIGIIVLPFLLGWYGFWLAIILFALSFMISSTRNSSIQYLNKFLFNPYTPEKILEIKKHLARIKKWSNNPETFLKKYLSQVILDAYWDKVFSDDEREVFGAIRIHLTNEQFEESLEEVFLLILFESLNDHDFSEGEKQFLADLLKYSNANDDLLQKLNASIEYFEYIESLRSATEIEEVTPSIDILSPGEKCFLELEGKYQKSKNVSEQIRFFVTNKFFHIYSGGHTKIKINDILEMSCTKIFNGELILSALNRKTPYNIQCAETLTVLEILKKVKEIA